MMTKPYDVNLISYLKWYLTSGIDREIDSRDFAEMIVLGICTSGATHSWGEALERNEELITVSLTSRRCLAGYAVRYLQRLYHFFLFGRIAIKQ